MVHLPLHPIIDKKLWIPESTTNLIKFSSNGELQIFNSEISYWNDVLALPLFFYFSLSLDFGAG
jgi:hypothetical protein